MWDFFFKSAVQETPSDKILIVKEIISLTSVCEFE